MKKIALPPTTKPADCWDWIKPEDVLRHALAAYYAACRYTTPPPAGEPWMRLEDGRPVPWNDRGGWLDTLVELLTLRLVAHAHELGVNSADHNYITAAEDLAKMTADTQPSMLRAAA